MKDKAKRQYSAVVRVLGLSAMVLCSFISTLAMAAVESPITNGLLVALDGTDVTTSGGNISSWNDQAALGGAESFSQGTAANRPSLLSSFVMPNGSAHNVVDFDRVSHEYMDLSADSGLSTNAITAIMVVRGNTMEDGASGYFISTADSNDSRRWTVGERDSNNRWIELATSSAGSAKIRELTGVDQDEWCIVSMKWDGITGDLNARSLSEAGELIAGTVSGATAPVYSHVLTRLGANSATTPAYYFDGQLAEVLIYNRVLSAKDLADVEQYLKYKFFATRSIDPPVTNGLLIGMDGEDVIMGSGKILYWNDQSVFGAAENFYQGTLGYRPALLTNYVMPDASIHNIVDFDGADDYLECSHDSDLSTNAVTSFLVIRGNAMEDSKTGYILSTATDVAMRWATGERGDNNMWFIYAHGSKTSVPNLTGINQDEWCIVSMRWDGGSGDFSGRSRSQNGTLVTTSDAGVTLTSETHSRTRLGANTATTPAYYFDGQIAEVLVYNRALTEDEILSVEHYLNLKYFVNQGTVIIVK